MATVTVLRNIAPDGLCTQSSRDPLDQPDPDGAQKAVVGTKTGDLNFCTLREDNPWWQIDFGELRRFEAVVVYNFDRLDRRYALEGRRRTRYLQLLTSHDGQTWTKLYDRSKEPNCAEPFGGILHGPLLIETPGQSARFVRLALASGVLQLDTVEIYAVDAAEVDEAACSVVQMANDLNHSIARRNVLSAGLDPAALQDIGRRFGLDLTARGRLFIANMLVELGRAPAAVALIESAADTRERDAAAMQSFVVRPSDLPNDDLHWWVGQLPEYNPGSYDWVDNAFHFRSVDRVGDIDVRAPVIFDPEPSLESRIFFAGGCEFTYAGFFLRLQGHQVYDVFLHNVSSDPIAEFVSMGGERARQFDPDLIVMSIEQPFKSLLGKTLLLNGYAAAQQRGDLDILIAGLEQAIVVAQRVSPRSKICLLSHIVYTARAFPLYEEATFGNLLGDTLTATELAKFYDLALAGLARKHGLMVLDFEEFIAKFGKSSSDGRHHNVRPHELLGGHPEYVGGSIISNTICGWLKAVVSKEPKVKLIVLDLDNTMWDGVLREDGYDFVRGHWRTDRSDAVTYLAEQGILVALCSKNDEAATDQVHRIFAECASQIANKIVATRINWQPKSENIKSIVTQLKIGIDTVAFFDDQAFERAEVVAALPGIRVFTDTDLLQVGRYAPFLPASPISAQGRSRADSYISEGTRLQEQSKFGPTDYSAFLVSCRFELTLRPGNLGDIPRLGELFLRTNQQNVTLRRTSAELVRHALTAADKQIWCCELRDRFGDYGMIGALLVNSADTSAPEIFELAFSCRAMGKGIEKAFLERLGRYYEQRQARRLIVPVVRTAKNAGMIDIIKTAGFEDQGDSLRLELDALNDERLFDPWINWSDCPSTEAAANPEAVTLHENFRQEAAEPAPT